MKHFYTFICLITLQSIFAQTPTLSWVASGGGLNSADKITAMDVDAAGNVYVAGYYNQEAQFGTTILDNGFFNSFIIKYDPLGAIVWIKAFQGRFEILSLKVDSQENIVIAGHYSFDQDIDPSENEFLLTNGGNGFIAKFDNNGLLLWAGDLGLSNSTYVYDVALDESDNIYATGSFSGSIDMDIQETGVILNGGLFSNAFLASYAPNGSHLWSFAVSAGESSLLSGQSIHVQDEMILMVGEFGGTGDFDSSANEATKSTEGSAWFISKYTTSGAYVWANVFESDDPWLTARAVSVDADIDGNAYVLGHFVVGFDADPSAADHHVSGSPFVQNTFLAKYNTSGSYVWATGFTSESDSFPREISVDGQGNSVAIGRYGDAIHFSSINGTNGITLAGSTDVYLALYDTNGQLKAGNSYGSNEDSFKQSMYDEAGGVILTENNLYASGGFMANSNFEFPDQEPVTLTIDSDNCDTFLVKYNLESLDLDEAQITAWSAYPNPVNNILEVVNVSTELQLFDIRGRKLSTYPAQTMQIDMTGLASGIYLLTANSTTLKIMKTQ